jgi:nicotinamidase-related amidase
MRTSFKLKMRECALLIIDMVKYFCDKEGNAYIPGSDILIKKVKKLVDVFSRNNRPIIFTRHIDSDEKNNMMTRWWNENIRADDPMSEIIDDFDTSRGEVIVKNQYDAFLNTNLGKILKKKNVKQVVITGVLTNLCCETSARSAFMRGFEVYFITDGTATYKKEMHDATLLNLSYGFAVLLSVDDVIKEMENPVL